MRFKKATIVWCLNYNSTTGLGHPYQFINTSGNILNMLKCLICSHYIERIVLEVHFFIKTIFNSIFKLRLIWLFFNSHLDTFKFPASWFNTAKIIPQIQTTKEK